MRGKPDYRWQKKFPPIDPKAEAGLFREGRLTLDETHLLPRDADGAPVTVAGGSVHWNAHRKRWIAILDQICGASELGEVWYAEADAPTGSFRLLRGDLHRRVLGEPQQDAAAQL